MQDRRGATLVEVLISFVIVAVASTATLQYFGIARGMVGKTGNHRAAVERARERLEQLMASDIAQLPPRDGNCYACVDATCAAASWAAYGCGATPPSDVIPVEVQGELRKRLPPPERPASMSTNSA